MNSDDLQDELNRIYGANPTYMFLDDITEVPSTLEQTMSTEQTVPLLATRDHYLPAAELMQRMGGSFASAIADAFFVADSYNTQRLLLAFPELFTRYKQMADADRQYEQALARRAQRG